MKDKRITSPIILAVKGKYDKETKIELSTYAVPIVDPNTFEYRVIGRFTEDFMRFVQYLKENVSTFSSQDIQLDYVEYSPPTRRHVTKGKANVSVNHSLKISVSHYIDQKQYNVILKLDAHKSSYNSYNSFLDYEYDYVRKTYNDVLQIVEDIVEMTIGEFTDNTFEYLEVK